MDNSIYVALSKQVTMFRDMNTTANNIANATTSGYQAEKTLFTDYLTDDGNREKIAYTQDIATYHDLRQGSMNVTGNQLDVAIQGDGYFVVETGAGQRYTRAGSFHIGGDGTLMTISGHPVLDDAGQRIQFQPQDSEIRVGENGNLSVNGEERGILGVVEFPNRQQLKRMENVMYEAPEGVEPEIAVNSRVVQGALEKSNVQPVNELVRLTELSRVNGSTAKFIETMYDMQRKASNTWTKQQ